jgi:hypothetical protein
VEWFAHNTRTSKRESTTSNASVAHLPKRGEHGRERQRKSEREGERETEARPDDSSTTMAHYAFSNLLGAPYRGGNLCMNGNRLLTSVGNRVTEVDLQLSSCTTLPSENLTEIACTAVSPSGAHMISFDTDGRAILVNLRWESARRQTNKKVSTNRR